MESRQPSQHGQPPADGGDWRRNFQPETRRKIVNKITSILMEFVVPFSDEERRQELHKIAARFEEKIYNAATDKSDYIRKISLKMLSVESKSNCNFSDAAAAAPSNPAGLERDPHLHEGPDMLLQVQNQGQSLPTPTTSNQLTSQGQQQHIVNNIENDNSSAGKETSTSLPYALPSVNSLAHCSMSNVVQNSNIQNISGTSQYSVVQGAGFNCTDSLNQTGRQNEQQPLNRKLQDDVNSKPFMQPPVQDQSHIDMLKPVQSPSSQKSLAQNLSSTESTVISVSGQRQDQHSIHERQPRQHSQHAAEYHTRMSQQPMLKPQLQHELDQQRNLMGQQQIEQHTSTSDMQQQPPPMVPGQLKHMSNSYGPSQTNEQDLQQMGQQNNPLSSHQQDVSGGHITQLFEQNQHFGSKSSSSGVQSMQKQIVSMQQQSPFASYLPSGGRQQHSQQEMMSRMSSEMERMEQQFVVRQRQISVEHNMQQKIQTSSPLLQEQNVNGQQKTIQTITAVEPSGDCSSNPLLQQQNAHDQQRTLQRIPAVGPSASFDLAPQTGSSGDWQEEVCQKIKALKDMYFAHLREMYQEVCIILQERVSHPDQSRAAAVEKLITVKQVLELSLKYLQVTKSNVKQVHKDKLGDLQKQINSLLRLTSLRKLDSPLLEGQLPPPYKQSVQHSQQSEAQISQTQSHDHGTNSPLQSTKLQIASDPTRGTGLKKLNFDVGIGHTSVPQGTTESIEQGSLNASQQGSIRSGTHSNLLGSNISSHVSCSHIFRRKDLKQQQQQETAQRMQPKETSQQCHTKQLLQTQEEQQEQKPLHMQQVNSLSPVPLSSSTSLPAPMLGDHEKPKTEVFSQWSEEKSRVERKPLSHLLEVVKSMSSKALSASISDIGAILSMTDRIPESAPRSGSCASADENLADVMNRRLEVRDPIMHDQNGGIKRMRHHTSSALLSAVSSMGCHSDSYTQLTGSDGFDLDCTATSALKRCIVKINPVLLKEIKEINERLIDTVVDISKGEVGPNPTPPTTEGGIFVKCSYSPVALCPSLKLLYGSAQMPPIQPLRLLVPAAYPYCSPILLDNMSLTFSKESYDLSSKAMSRFSCSLRALPQPMSLAKIAREWDACVRSVITEYAEMMGGGTFSSKYGTFEKCSGIA